MLSHVSKLPNLARLKAVVLPSLSQNSQNTAKQQFGSVYDNDGKMPSLVLEHAGQNARWLCHGLGCDPTSLTSEQRSGGQKKKEPYFLTEFEIKYYLCHLLVALDALHSRGIMHRDVSATVLYRKYLNKWKDGTPQASGFLGNCQLLLLS